MLKLRKAVLGVLIGSFVACVAAAISIDQYFYLSLPRFADEKTGHVCKLVVSHGSVRYGSQGELHALQAVQEVFPMGAILFLAAVLLGLRWGIFHVGSTGRVKQGQPGAKETTPR
jgi:hypothetical protein